MKSPPSHAASRLSPSHSEGKSTTWFQLCVDSPLVVGADLQGCSPAEMLQSVARTLLQYALAPSIGLLLLLGFIFWLGPGTLPDSAKTGPIGIMISLAVWVGLAAAPGYLRGCWVVAHEVSVRPLQACWILVSIVSGLLLALVGGIMSLFTIVLGIAGFAAAGSAMWLLKDFLPLVKRATPPSSEAPPNL